MLNAKAASVIELARIFLKLGATSFGGPAAHIAMMEDEFVKRRGWLSHQQFLDMLSATNLIPGPNSTEMAIHIGHHRAGLKGLLVAGLAFIAPAVLITCGFAWAYLKFGAAPTAAGILYGVKAVVLAIVLQALWRLGRSALCSSSAICIALFAVALYLWGLNEIAVLALASAAGLLFSRRVGTSTKAITWGIGLGASIFSTRNAMVAAATTTALSISQPLWPIFWSMFEIGATLFGSGYVLLAYLKSDFVDRLGWLTQAQLLDAIAIGQLTPGPLFSTATFVGYLLSGPAGALVATVGIFLPAFVLVAITAPFLQGLRNSKLLSSALDTLNAASFALMAVVSAHLARSAVVDLTTLLLATVSLVLITRYSLNSTWLLLAAGVLGTLIR